ncbi:AAA family ATPase [Myxococcus xanthus]|nr:AAA family ATPase [Myxococcus xanthus]
MQIKPDTSSSWSLCFFNNKGGVGKTTLACNIASQLARKNNLRVLLVDADPQCNATQLILSDSQTETLYESGKIEANEFKYEVDTLKDVLSPIVAGEATLKTRFSMVDAKTNRFGIDLLPGHPEIALLEDKLSQNWSSLISGDLGGARVTNWNTQLLRHLQGKYDLIVYDVGPSLGALNRAVLVGVDFFLAPMGCDIFSLIGINNIAAWLRDWQDVYTQGLSQCNKRHREAMMHYEIKKSEASMCRFIGYTVQQYITKTIRKERRATGAYEEILKSIPGRITERLGPLTALGLSNKDLRLGDVPHMFSLVPLAQTAHAPIDGLTGKDGLSGGQFGQQTDYQTFISELSDSMLRNLRKVQSNQVKNQ